MLTTSLGLALTLAAWLLVGRAARPWMATDRPDTAGAALTTAATLGLGAGLLAFHEASALRLVHGTVLASDFDQYCAAVGAVRAGAFELVPPQRGVPGAWLPALLSRGLGVVDGLLATSAVAVALGFTGLALWARSAFGRGGGAVAVVAALAFTPFGALARMVTFHPMTISLGITTAALAVAASRYRSIGLWVAGLVSGGLLLLLDARGILSAALPLGVLAFTALRQRHPPRRLAGVAAMIAVLATSWQAAHHLVPSHAPGLEHQTLRMWQEQTARARADGTPTPPSDVEALDAALEASLDHEFLWGHRGAEALVASVARLATIGPRVPPLHDTRARGLSGPWPHVAGAALLLVLVLAGRARDRDVWLGLLLLGPALAIGVSATRGIAHPRYLAAATPVVVVPLAALYRLWPRATPSTRRWQAPAASEPFLLAVVGMLLFAGLPPTPLSRAASWRRAVLADTEPRDTLLVVQAALPEAAERDPRCRTALEADHAAGHAYGSDLLGWHPFGGPVGAEPLR